MALTCALSDTALIVAGVAGFGSAVIALPWLPTVMRLAGAGFLIVYGALRLRAAWLGSGAMSAVGGGGSLMSVLTTCLALTWLNPHVYLDTFGLIGAISTGYQAPPAKTAFATGAVLASFSFFFGLAYGAGRLAPLMRRPGAWRVLDIVIAIVMWSIAAGLLSQTPLH